MRSLARLAAAVSLLVPLALAPACERGPRLYDAEGTLTEVRADLRQVMIDHEDIPGLMPAMVMSFDVADTVSLEGLAAGDHVHFRISHDGESFRIVEITPAGEAGSAGAAGSGGVLGDEPVAPGGLSAVASEAQPAPPFELVDQDGAPRSLASLRGKALLLDFVYANCPGPCPILTGTHVRVQKVLPEALRERVWFVSITLDPERDTPEVLRRYASSRGAQLDNWSFLGGSPAQIEDVLARYGVGKVPAPGGEIQHVVVTFLIDREGRIAKRYFGLEHHADDIARDLAALAETGDGVN